MKTLSLLLLTLTFSPQAAWATEMQQDMPVCLASANGVLENWQNKLTQVQKEITRQHNAKKQGKTGAQLDPFRNFDQRAGMVFGAQYERLNKFSKEYQALCDEYKARAQSMAQSNGGGDFTDAKKKFNEANSFYAQYADKLQARLNEESKKFQGYYKEFVSPATVSWAKPYAKEFAKIYPQMAMEKGKWASEDSDTSKSIFGNVLGYLDNSAKFAQGKRDTGVISAQKVGARKTDMGTITGTGAARSGQTGNWENQRDQERKQCEDSGRYWDMVYGCRDHDVLFYPPGPSTTK